MLLITDNPGKRIPEPKYMKAALTEIPAPAVSCLAQHGLAHAFGCLVKCWPPLDPFTLRVRRNNDTPTRSI